MINLHAQKQYKCYHLQEFIWNSQTEKYDKSVEKNDQSIFNIDAVSKTLVQVFEDGSSITYNTVNDSFDKEKSIYTYKIISPSNGYRYTYNIISKSNIIEVLINQKGEDTLLKRYLFKN